MDPWSIFVAVNGIAFLVAYALSPFQSITAKFAAAKMLLMNVVTPK